MFLVSDCVKFGFRNMFESLKSTDFTLFLALLPAFVKGDFLSSTCVLLLMIQMATNVF